MTNKLGSSNPNKIPKPNKKIEVKTPTMLGEDLRQFNLEKTFKEFVDKDKSMANRIDELIRIKTKQVNTLNYFIDVHDNCQERLDKGVKDPKTLLLFNKVIKDTRKSIYAFQGFIATCCCRYLL